MSEKSQVYLYWKNCHSDVIMNPKQDITSTEQGVTGQALNTLQKELAKALRQVVAPSDVTRQGFINLPTHQGYRDQVKAFVKKYRDQGITDLVVLGIGGSALGTIALQSALVPNPTKPRLHVLDNVDPDLVHRVMEDVRPYAKTTLINVISKSGDTAETAAQFMAFLHMLRTELKLKDGEFPLDNILVTTDMGEFTYTKYTDTDTGKKGDPMKSPNEDWGSLFRIATRNHFHMLPVPNDVGGRFSVLAPVGLFPAAMCGIDIDDLLAGAADMQDRCHKTTWKENPAMLLAALKYIAYEKGNKIDVMMPYSNRLYYLADWYRQLWAESLGKIRGRAGHKEFVGPTPIKALGVTDQHSQLQLYLEGPDDKFVQFIEVTQHPQKEPIPPCGFNEPDMNYLEGRSFGELIRKEQLATECAMIRNQRPSVTIVFDAITAFSVGEFIYLYEMATSIFGELLNVDAFDQPAVQQIKDFTCALMDRQGKTKKDNRDYEDIRRDILPLVKRDKKFLV